MSRNNVELVRRAFEALKTGGVEAGLEFVAPDGVTYTPAEWMEDSEYRGHEGFRRLNRLWSQTFDDWSVETPEELRDAGDRVAVLFHHSGKIKGTEVPIRQEIGAVYSDFRDDGRIGEARFFQCWTEALEAAGLREHLS